MMVRREDGFQPGKLYRCKLSPKLTVVILSVHGNGLACPCVYLIPEKATINKHILYVDEWEELCE